MKSVSIQNVEVEDVRYPLPPAAGTDAVHTGSMYAWAVTRLKTGDAFTGTGIVLTLGKGNEVVCEAIKLLSTELVGCEIEELMGDFGKVWRRLADHPQLRWLGPHKGVIHLALASITNACFDLWAKVRGVPLWSLLLSLTPAEITRLLDFSYLEDALTAEEAREILESELARRPSRESVLRDGYPGYDTSVGWFLYEDQQVKEKALRALESGFRAFKLKVGSPDGARDLRRAHVLQDAVGPDALVMFDANQQWSLPRAVEMCRALTSVNPYWIEEPTHPDDVNAHRVLAQAIDPLKIALGEHVPNRVTFKNFMRAGAVHYVQVDCTRVGGVSEFLTVSLLARKLGLPVIPHAGDMGQIHQHLVLFNHIALGHEKLFMEYIPHLKDYFVHPAEVRNGVYQTPQDPGCSTDLRTPR